MELTLGGTTGLLGATAGVYAGVLGGAVVGTMFGAGLGPAIASVGSEGVLGFLGTAWTSTKIAAKIGMVVGGAAGVTGGWVLGKSIGSIPAAATRFIGKKILGYDPDAGQDKKNSDLIKLKGPLKAIGYGIGGAGLLTGAAGGAIIGGAVAAAGDLTAGLLAQGVSLSSIAGAAGVGAAVGGGVLGIAGAVGGYKLVNAIRHGITGGVKAVETSQRWIELDEKQNRLTAAEERLSTLRTDLGSNSGAAVANHEDRTRDFDNRDVAVGEANDRVKYKNEHKAELVEKRAQQLYDQTKQGLVDREAGLDRRDNDLKAYDARVKDVEVNIDAHIDRRQNELYTALETKLEGEYTSRRTGLETRDRELDQREANIPSAVRQKVEAALQPLRQELAQRQENARNDERRADQLRVQAQADYAAIPHLQSEASSERDAAARARSQADGVRPRFQQLNSEVNSKRAQVESRKMDLQRRDADLRRRGC